MQSRPTAHDPADGRDHGFTLVELLVVIIVIGILAAVAVPLYLRQTHQANDATAKADVHALGTMLRSELADLDLARTNADVSLVDERYVLTLTSAVAGSAPWATIDLGPASTGVEVLGIYATAEAEDSRDRTNWCISTTHEDGTEAYFRYTLADGLEVVTESTACLVMGRGFIP